MSSRGRRLALTVVLAAATCLATRPAVAQLGWSGGVDLLSSPVPWPGSLTVSALVVDADGRATLAWHERVDSSFVQVVKVARSASADGPWSDPHVLSAPGILSFLVAVTDQTGNVTVAWTRRELVSRVEVARFHMATGEWSAVSVLSDFVETAVWPILATDVSDKVVVAWCAISGVRAARYQADTGAWSSAATLGSATNCATGPRIGSDAAGIVTVAWIQSDDSAGVVQASRYSPTLDAWGPATRLSPMALPIQWFSMAVAASGDVIVAWVRDAIIQAAVFSGGAWGDWVLVSPPGGQSAAPKVAIDAAGNAIVVWWEAQTFTSGAIRSRRRWQGVWRPSETLSEPTVAVTDHHVVVDEAGRTTVVWRDGPAVMAARSEAGQIGWTLPVNLSPVGIAYPITGVATDPVGNVFVLWSRVQSSAGQRLQAARFAVSTATWTLETDLSAEAQVADFAHVAVDAHGTATAAWLQSTPLLALSAVRSMRWLATPGPVTVTGIVPGSGTLDVHVTPPPTSDAAFAVSNYAYSLDDGATWSGRDPASTASPIAIGELTDGTTYTVRVRAINTAGSGQSSAPVTATAGLVPGPPVELVVTWVDGNLVTLAWTAPPGGVTPTGYLVEGGLHPGETLVGLRTSGTESRFTLRAPSGTYYVRVVALAGVVRSPPSNEVRVVIGLPRSPSAPTGLRGLVNGSSVSLSWTNTLEGGTPTGLRLRVTGSAIATYAVPVGDHLTVAGVPLGTYTLSVSATNASGASGPSNRVTLTVPGLCGGVPDPPTAVQAWERAGVVFLSWRPPATGTAVTSYTVEVSGAYAGRVTTTERFVYSVAAPGTYTLRVAAANACGQGEAAAPVTVVVP